MNTVLTTTQYKIEDIMDMTVSGYHSLVTILSAPMDEESAKKKKRNKNKPTAAELGFGFLTKKK